MKKLLLFLIAITLGVSVMAQQIPSVKAIRFVNLLDSNEFVPGSGGAIAYFEQTDKFMVYEDEEWRRMFNFEPNISFSNIGIIRSPAQGSFNAFKTNLDVIGQGTVTLTNGSSAVTGIGTNFLDATPGKGLSYWFSFNVIDANGDWYRIFLSSITSDTQATISVVRNNNDQVVNGGTTNQGSTFPGVTGTYTYRIVENRAEGLYGFSWGNNSYASNFATAFGGASVATGQTSFATGFETHAVGNQSSVFGRNVQATGNASFSGGWGVWDAVTGNKKVLASGQTSFNWSQNNTSQTVGHGAGGIASAILGGFDHNIPSTSHRSVILGGDQIKAEASTTNTVFVPKLRINRGLNASIVQDDTNNNLLVRDAVTGEVKQRSATTLWSTTGETLLDGAASIVVPDVGSTLQIRSEGFSNDLTIDGSTFSLTGGGSFVYNVHTGTFVGKHTFTPTATSAGVNLGLLAGDPTSPQEGDFWFNTNEQNLKYRRGATAQNVRLLGTVGSLGAGQLPFLSTVNGQLFMGESALTYTSATNTLNVENIKLTGATPMDNANDSILVRDGFDGSIKLRSAATIGGGNFIRSDANTELQDWISVLGGVNNNAISFGQFETDQLGAFEAYAQYVTIEDTDRGGITITSRENPTDQSNYSMLSVDGSINLNSNLDVTLNARTGQVLTLGTSVTTTAETFTVTSSSDGVDNAYVHTTPTTVTLTTQDINGFNTYSQIALSHSGTNVTNTMQYNTDVSAANATNDRWISDKGYVDKQGRAYSTMVTAWNIGTGEDVIASYTVPANAMTAAKKSFKFLAAGVTDDSPNAKTIRVKAAGTNIIEVTGIETGVAVDWRIEGECFKEDGGPALRCSCTYTSSSAAKPAYNKYTTPPFGPSVANDIQVTGEGTDDMDVMIGFFKVSFENPE